MYRGSVPQHPPAMVAPKSTNLSTWKANSSTPHVYMVIPSEYTGNPAFGWAITGTLETFVIVSIIG